MPNDLTISTDKRFEIPYAASQQSQEDTTEFTDCIGILLSRDREENGDSSL